MYHVVEMNLDAEGNGPADPENTVSTQYEVWSPVFTTVAVSPFKPIADAICDSLNSSPATAMWPSKALFKFGDQVQKKSGSWWEGKVCGWYRTEQTPMGYCVQIDKPNGPVQIYPESALELKGKTNA